jgi:hypothetical protein
MDDPAAKHCNTPKKNRSTTDHINIRFFAFLDAKNQLKCKSGDQMNAILVENR